MIIVDRFIPAFSFHYEWARKSMDTYILLLVCWMGQKVFMWYISITWWCCNIMVEALQNNDVTVKKKKISMTKILILSVFFMISVFLIDSAHQILVRWGLHLLLSRIDNIIIYREMLEINEFSYWNIQRCEFIFS